MVRRMTRTGAIVLLISGLAMALLALWLGGGLIPVPPGPPSSGGSAGDLRAHFRALDIVPLDGAKAATFALPTLAGQRVSLADFEGRPVLLYFWATW
jgi:cytochrome oxidase Cu insertion factor (SCO1/SenC/PrrC family)